MSGGSLDYVYCTLQDHVGDFGDKELDELTSDLSDLFYAREWYLSGDTGVGSWNEARDAFKSKWFGQNNRAERIERYLAEFTEEIRKSLGISDMYCRNCKHWSDDNDGSNYGRCACVKNHLMHRRESCERFERRGNEKRQMPQLR